MASLTEGPKSLSPKDRKPFLKRTGTKIALAGSAAVLAGAGIGAKLGFFERGDSPAQVSVATVPATVVPTEGPQLATPMPSLTPEVTQAPNVNPDAKFPPATPEAQVEVPCIIVPQEFCSQTEHGEKTDSRGTWTIIGMNLPEGTPIRSPIKGQVSKTVYTQPANFNGSSANIFNPEDQSQGTFVLLGDLNFDNPDVTTDANPETLVADIGNTGARNDGYNLEIIVKKDSAAYELLKKLFPDTLEQPPKDLGSINLTNTAPNKTSSPVRGTPPR